MLQLTINGESKTFPRALTLSEMVEALALDPREVAIAMNQRIIARSDYSSTRLAEGDAVELVSFIGGG